MQRINIDEIVRSFGKWDNPADVLKAGKMAVEKQRELMRKGEDFNQETTLCEKSIVELIKKNKSGRVLHRDLLCGSE